MLEFPRWKIIAALVACGFFIFAALPNFLSEEQRAKLPGFMPQRSVSLGLDLQGGSHLLLQMDFAAYEKEQMQNLRDEARQALRKARVGYRELKAEDTSVLVTVRSETLKGEADPITLLQKLDPDLTVTQEAQDAYRLSYNETITRSRQLRLVEQSIEIVGRRVNETGTKEPIIQRQGRDRILVQVPGLQDPEKLKRLLGTTAKMTFHLVDETVTAAQIESGIVSPDVMLLSPDDSERGMGGQALYPIRKEVALSGELLTNASATYSEGQPVVSFQFNSLGAQKFGEITQANVGQRFAVVLDDKVITAPVIRSAILGGSGIIEGNFTVETANQLAILLRAGALPAPMTIIEERSVGPSLGADSIRDGMRASIAGIALVVTFMVVCYGLFGLFANVALMMNIVIILGVMSLLQATLTLPGIAGIVLTLGMAVDANVLIYERMREELRNGKSALASIDSGFKAAFRTITDSNITTLLAALILYYFGAGPIKGFAVTLAIGILASMFTAVSLTKLIIVLWYRRKRPKLLPV